MLSIIVPGIRNYNWVDLYESFRHSLGDEIFEVIFAGPYQLPVELEALKNVKFIRDWGNQIRCQQLALLLAEGEYVHWCSDDGVALPGALLEGLNILRMQKEPAVVMLKYLESDNPSPDMYKDEYYLLSGYHGTTTEYIPKSFYGLNTAIAPTALVKMLGGWDARFGSCIAHADFAVRVQREKIKVIVSDIVAHHVGHMPGTTGDHGPMYYVQVENDEPLFQKLWGGPESFRNIIPLDNWKQVPAVWEKRFGS